MKTISLIECLIGLIGILATTWIATGTQTTGLTYLFVAQCLFWRMTWKSAKERFSNEP